MSPKSKDQFEEAREKSKENILNSALKLFSKKGFFNTSIRQIATQANISNGLMYNYFKSKEDLLVEIVNKSFTLMNSVIINDKELNANEKIEQTINKTFDLIQNKKKLLRMMLQIGLQAEKFEFVNKMIAKKYDEEIEILADSFQKIGIVNNKIEASIFLATLDGIMLQYMIMKNEIPFNEMRNAMIEKYKKQ